MNKQGGGMQKNATHTFVLSQWGRWALGAVLGFGAVWAQAQTQEMPLVVSLMASGSDPGQNGLGDEVQVMTQAVIDEYNDSGIGPYIELQVIDSDSTDAKALQAQAQGSMALLSCAGLRTCLSQAQVAKTLGLPLVGPMSGDARLRSPELARSVFSVRPSNTEMLQSALQGLSTMRIKKLAVLVQADANGKSLAAELARLNLPKGLEVVHQAEIEAGSNFAAASKAMQTAGATAVLLLTEDVPTAQALVGHLKAQRKSAQAYTPMLMHMPGLALPEYAEKAQGYPGGAMFVTVVPSPWGGRKAAQRSYQSLAQSRGIYRANYVSFEAYLNAKLLVQAVAQSKARSPAQLSQYLAQQQFNLGGMSVRYTAGRGEATGFLDQAALGVDGSFRH